MVDLFSTTVYSAQTSGSSVVFLIIVYLALYVIFALGQYGAFKKAAEPGWAAFVPFYNWWVTIRISGRPQAWFWFILLLVVPFVGAIAVLVIAIIVLNDVSKSFGHGGAFTVGLVLLGPIFWYILWLGPSRYLGPAAKMGYPPGGYPPGGYPPGGYPPGGYPQGGYPAPQPGYPPAQQPYPPAQQPYPPAQQPYPPAQQPYPPQQQPPPGPPQ